MERTDLDAVHARVAQIIAELAKTQPAEVLLEANLTNLGIDSVSHLILWESLERAFPIVISDEDRRTLETVKSVADLVVRKT